MATPLFSPRLSSFERYGLWLLLILIAGFGALVVNRNALLSRKMGDLDCYLRGAWALRTGHDLYATMDDSGWHYNYPPLLAVMLMPLADPPAGESRAGVPPFAVSVAIWYALSVLCVAIAVHCLANALEERRASNVSADRGFGSRRWWALRLYPVLICLVPVGHSLMRGQVNPLVLALFCAMFAAHLRGRSAMAGFWLAGAICIKVYPAFLLIVPIFRRDLRCLGGCFVGSCLGLVVVPAAVMGIPGTFAAYRTYCQVTLAPGLGAGGDDSRATELTNVTGTDSQSFLAVFHNTLHSDRWTRPHKASPMVRLAALTASGVLTLLTLLAGWRKREAKLEFLFGTAFLVAMLLLCPICHLHYFMFLIPLVMGLLEQVWQKREPPRVGLGLAGLLGFFFVANALPTLPGLELVRDLGLAMYGALALWLVTLCVLLRRPDARPVAAILPAPVYPARLAS